MESIESQVESLISSNKVMIFSKSQCPYCKDAKEILSKGGVKFESKELDRIKDGKEMQKYLH